jgi:hypothetical protein
MRSDYQQAMLARTIVTRLSPEWLVILEKWLRGHATRGTCSSGAGRPDATVRSNSWFSSHCCALCVRQCECVINRPLRNFPT